MSCVVYWYCHSRIYISETFHNVDQQLVNLLWSKYWFWISGIVSLIWKVISAIQRDRKIFKFLTHLASNVTLEFTKGLRIYIYITPYRVVEYLLEATPSTTHHVFRPIFTSQWPTFNLLHCSSIIDFGQYPSEPLLIDEKSLYQAASQFVTLVIDLAKLQSYLLDWQLDVFTKFSGWRGVVKAYVH